MTQFITQQTGVSSSITAYYQYYYSNYPWDTKQHDRSISPKLLNQPWSQGCAAQHLHTWLSSRKSTAINEYIKDLMTAIWWETAQRQVVHKDRCCRLQFLHTKNIPIWVGSKRLIFIYDDDDVELNVFGCRVDVLEANCDQCLSVVQRRFTSTETVRLLRTGNPGRPPWLSHSSWTLYIYLINKGT